MAKTYWIGTYRAVTNPDKLVAYAQLAGPAIAAGGGTFIVIEFQSLAQAVAAHDSAAYQAALEALGDGAERDIRLVEGV